MFSQQILSHMTVHRTVSVYNRERILAAILDAWKTDENLRREILHAQQIPAAFQDREAPGRISCMTYVLEDPDYPLLFALFKQDTFIGFPPGTPAARMDRVVEETHAVFRLLRARARAPANPVPAQVLGHARAYLGTRTTSWHPIAFDVEGIRGPACQGNP